MKEQRYVVYKTVNKLNGKIYVGLRRLDLEKGYLGSGKLISSAVDKYGITAFDREILCVCVSRNDADDKEKTYINSLSANDRNIGYNIAKGGNGGDTFTHNPNKEKIRTQCSLNSKKLHADGILGIFSEESKFKMSKSAKARSKPNRTKIYQLTSPVGTKFISDGALKKFCSENKLSYNTIRKYINKGLIPIEFREQYNTTLRMNTSGWIISEIVY